MKRNEENATYRSVYKEREYGAYWYSGLWRILRPLLVGLTVAVIVLGLIMSLFNRLYREYAAPVDAGDDTEIAFAIESGQSLTHYQAAQMGIMGFPARISELRAAGYPIICTMQPHVNKHGKTVKHGIFTLAAEKGAA